MDMIARKKRLLMMPNGNPIHAGCEIGTFEVDENSYTVTIPHSLGEVPKFAYCVIVPNSSWANIPNADILMEDLMSDPQTGVFDITLNSNRKRNNVVGYNAASNIAQGTGTYTTYPAAMTSTDVTFATGQYYSYLFKPGYKYVYVIVK